MSIHRLETYTGPVEYRSVQDLAGLDALWVTPAEFQGQAREWVFTDGAGHHAAGGVGSRYASLRRPRLRGTSMTMTAVDETRLDPGRRHPRRVDGQLLRMDVRVTAQRLNGVTHLRCDAVTDPGSFGTCPAKSEMAAGINVGRQYAIRELRWLSAPPAPRSRGTRDYCPDHRDQAS